MDSSGCTDFSSDVLSVLSTFLTKNSDSIRFRSVCTQWRHAAVPKPQLPLLLLDGVRVLGPSTKTWDHNSDLLSETKGKYCYASSHGWLVLASSYSSDIVLFNPITRTKISLAPLTSLPFVIDPGSLGVLPDAISGGVLTTVEVLDYVTKKIVLSSNPSVDDNFTAMAIITPSSVGFWRRGLDKTWIITDVGLAYICDICHSDKLFYSLHSSARVIVWDEESRTRIAMVSLVWPESQDMVYRHYLVPTSDGLLVVARYVSCTYSSKFVGEEINQFKVYEVDFDSTGGAITRRARALTNRALFVGEKNSLAVPSAAAASGFPKENSVYFVEFGDRKYRMKVFDLVDGRSEVLAEVDMYQYRNPPVPAAIWFTPSLW